MSFMVQTRKIRVLFGMILPAIMLLFAALACDIDQNFPPLTVGDTPQTFDPAIGEIHTWPATVTPGVNYEVVIALKGESEKSQNAINDLWVRCAPEYHDCSESVRGAVTVEGLKTTFVGPESGEILILFIPNDPLGLYTIQIREIGE
jgi:hypothetical protein